MRRIIICFIALCNVLIANAYHYDSNPSAINGSTLQTSMTTEITNFDFVDLANNSSFYLENPFGLMQIERTNGITPIKVSFQLNYYYVYKGVLIQKSELVTLNLEGDKKIDYLKAVGALKLEITNLTITGNVNDFKFTSTCRGERFDLFTQSTVKVSSLTKDVSKALTNGHLIVSWQEKLGDVTTGIKPEAYELEWTYISESLSNAFLRDYAFQNNSSRVVVSDNSYKIPLVYEKGIIVYRVRALGYTWLENDLTLVRTPWTLDDKSTSLEESISLTSIPESNYFEFDGLETNLNWQSTITFAEEGKNKAVVSYHDGTLRNRQALTRVNTDQRVVVGETYYDFNGRPVIQVLPVPDAQGTSTQNADKNSFYYRPNFNKDATGGELQKLDYEDYTCVGSYSPEELHTSSGASKYYSSDNGFIETENDNIGGNIINRELIADAEKFPYTQIRYRADNTDRVSAQSGVGLAHNMGSGHETKYLYGAPSQSEITRLFGTQVGNSAFYKKNAVIDPNGQVSVSYLNPEGKVVATALAGAKPNTLDKVGTVAENTRVIEDQLLNKATNKTTGNTINFEHPFGVSTAAKYDFKYTLKGDTFHLICHHPDGVTKLDIPVVGAYDVEVKLTDKQCTTTLFSQKTKTNGGFLNNAEVASVIEESHDLAVGEYKLSKTLTLNEAKLKEFLNTYLTDPNYTCVAREQYFIDQAKGAVDAGLCGLTCDQCNNKISSFIQQVENSGATLSASDTVNLHGVCELLCIDNMECAIGLMTMLADLNVDGQYAQITTGVKQQKFSTTAPEAPNEDNTFGSMQDDFANIKQEENGKDKDENPNPPKTIDPSKFPLSIFNSNSVLKICGFLDFPNIADPLISPNWKRPIKIKVTNNSVSTSGNTNKEALKAMKLGSQISYEETTYHNIAGERVYKIVQCTNCIGNTLPVYPTFDIQIDENAPKINIVGTNLYKVEIKYLTEFTDFIKEWQPNFAEYFVAYHPEFAYYEACKNLNELGKYKDELSALQYDSDLSNGKYFTKSGDFLSPNFVSSVNQSVYQAKDPFFASESPISLSDKQFLYSKLSNYTASQSLVAKANEIVHCTGLLCNTSNTACSTDKDKIADEEVFHIVKGMYLAKRDSIIKKYMHLYALNKMSYNACVGMDSYLGSLSEFFLLDNSPLIPELTYNKVSTYLNNETGRRKLGKKIRAAIAKVSNFVAPPKLRYIQSINPSQICSQSSYLSFYKNQRKVFLPELDGFGNTVPLNINCKRYVSSSNNWENSSCSIDVQTSSKRAVDLTYLMQYNSCGDCPIAQDVRELLSSVFDGDGVQTSLPQFNCQDQSVDVDLVVGKYLKEQLSGTDVLLDWEGSFNLVNKEYTGTIKTSSSSSIPSKKVVFKIDMNALQLKNGVNEVSKVMNLLKYARISNLTTNSSGSNIVQMYFDVNRVLPGYFTLTDGTTGIDFTSNFSSPILTRPSLKVINFPITIVVINSSDVSSPLNLRGDCPISNHCNLGKFGENVKALLNEITLSYSYNFTGLNGPITKSNDLFKTSNDKFQDFSDYDVVGLNMLNYDAEIIDNIDNVKTIEDFNMVWKKTSTPSLGFDYTGELTFINEVGTTMSYTINIQNLSSQSIAFNSISRFDNLRPDETSGDAKSMLADAFVLDLNAPNSAIKTYKLYPVRIQLVAGQNTPAFQLTVGCIYQSTPTLPTQTTGN